MIRLAYRVTLIQDLCGQASPGLIRALASVVDGERYSRRGLLAKVLETGNLMPGSVVRMAPPSGT